MHATKGISADGLKSTKPRRTKEVEHNAKFRAGAPTPDDSYVSNTHKENLCLEYVKNFRENFERMFPKRGELYLTAKNEFQVEKFVCTTVRPTQLQFRELYDLNKCSEFVAHFLDYEPLENPLSFPSTLPSSSQVLEWGVGDCFDFATLLASYLLGAGYDAYVVYGYAPKHICERDQSKTECPFVFDDSASARREASEENPQDQEAEKEENDGDDQAVADLDAAASPEDSLPASEEKKDDAQVSESNSSYKLRSYNVIESQFLKKNSSAEAKQTSAVTGGFKNEPIKWDSDEEDEALPYDQAGGASADPLSGKRVHCWVLVRGGKRDVPEMLFVEPSTARTYPVSSSPYLGIEAVWNAKNYWVNMQVEKDIIGHSYDFANNDLWEFVFIDNGPIILEEKQGERNMMDMLNDPIGEEEKGVDDFDEAAEEGKDAGDDDENDNILDIPESWVKKLKINKNRCVRRQVVNAASPLILFLFSVPPSGRLSCLLFLPSPSPSPHPSGTT